MKQLATYNQLLVPQLVDETSKDCFNYNLNMGTPSVEKSELTPISPKSEFQFLETLWFQVSGTLCNLRCGHCFISCSPNNHSLEMMKKDDIFRYLEQAKELGVKEIYYTGGEPFIHPDMLEILRFTLRDFPTSVLTNGLPLNDQRATSLKELSESSRFSLEVRISLDDYDEKRNDEIRGRGTFHQALKAYKRLHENGLLPILTVSEIHDYLHPLKSNESAYQKYVDLLKSLGVRRPRIKIIPVFEMGMLPIPKDNPLVTHGMMKGFDNSLLQCSSSRIVTDDGIYGCPILVGEKQSKMHSDSLVQACSPCSLYHPTCYTCYMTEMTCKNF